MRHSALILAALSLPSLRAIAQYEPPDPSGFQGLIVETYYVTDANDAADTDGGVGLTTGSVTYRVYADLKPGYKLLTVGGFPGHPITMSSSTMFFNNEDRGEAWGRNVGAQFLDQNTVAIDSWLTVGAASTLHWGVMKPADTDGSIVGGVNNDGGSNNVPGGLLVNSTAAMGLPLTNADGLWNTGTAPGAIAFVGLTPPDLFDGGGSNSYSNDDFAWAILGGALGPDTTNRILIGQFTTDGVLELCFNLNIRIPDELVCNDPNCHEIMEFYWELLPSDTAGGGFNTQNRFTHPTLCFNSSELEVDCEGVPDGPAVPGTACDDGNPDTDNDVYLADCSCAGEDCEGVVGGNALPGQPCDDGNPDTVNDTWQTGCICSGTVGIDEVDAPLAIRVRPNPTQGTLWLEIDRLNSDRMTVELTDLLGSRVLYTEHGGLRGDWQGSLDLSGLPQGLYLLQVRSGSWRNTLRVTKL